MRTPYPTPFRNAGRALVLAATVLIGSSPAGATVRNWSNAVSGSASTASNWSPSGAPTSADDAQFPAAGSYTVTWTSPQDTLLFLHTAGGSPTHSITSVLGVRSTASCVLGELAVSRGVLRANQILVGSAVGAKMRVTGGVSSSGMVVAGSPNARASFADTNSYIARLYVTNGGQFLSNSWIEASRKTFANCSLRVDGYRFSLGTYFRSTLGTMTNSGGGNRGDLILGAGGGTGSNAYLDVLNGGVVDVKGAFYVGRNGRSVEKFYETIPSTNPQLYVLGNTLVGANLTSAADGTGDLFISAGIARLGGNLQLGDVNFGIGTSGRGTLWMQGGSTVLGGQIVIPNSRPGRIVMSGGTLRLLSGISEIYQEETFSVSGSGSPELIVSGTAELRAYPGTGSPTALGVGRSSAGKVRGVGNGTHVTGFGPIAIADSAGGSGIVEVDSSGTFASSESITIGAGGQLSARRASFVSTPIGASPLRFRSDGSVILENSYLITSQGLFGAGGSFSGYGSMTGTFENQGSFAIPSPETLRVQGGLDNLGGTLSGGGTLEVYSNGHFLSSGSIGVHVHMRDATLAPHDPVSILSAPATASGKARPGVLGTIEPPLGHLVIGGNLSLSEPTEFVPASTVAIRIGSRASGLRDTLEVTGSATLNGTLALTSITGNEPMPGDTITVLEAGSVSGTFAAITVDGADPGSDVAVLYGPTSVRVVFVAPATAVGDDPGLTAGPAEIRFAARYGNHPTALVLELPGAARVRLAIYDVTGREVSRPADAVMTAGRHDFRLQRIPSGMYFARAEVEMNGQRVQRVARIAVLR